MKALVPYDFCGVDKVRVTFFSDDIPGFVVADIGRLLGLTNIRKRVNKLWTRYPDRIADVTMGYTSYDEPRKVGQRATQHVTIVDSFLFLKLIFDSEVEEAEKFQLRVHELLEEFSKHGFVIDKARADPAEVQQALDEFKATFGREPRGGVTVSPHDGAVVERVGEPPASLAEFRKRRWG